MTGKSNDASQRGTSTATIPEPSYELSRLDRIVTDDNYEPEVRLWRTVVMQSVSDAADRTTDHYLEVAEWLLHEDFETVCDLAELASDKLRPLIKSVLMAETTAARKYLAYNVKLAICEDRSLVS